MPNRKFSTRRSFRTWKDQINKCRIPVVLAPKSCRWDLQEIKLTAFKPTHPWSWEEAAAASTCTEATSIIRIHSWTPWETKESSRWTKVTFSSPNLCMHRYLWCIWNIVDRDNKRSWCCSTVPFWVNWTDIKMPLIFPRLLHFSLKKWRSYLHR